METREKYIVPSVESALKILRYLSGYQHKEASIGEISSELNIHRSTCYRLLLTLEKHNYVEYDSHSKKYRLGLFPVILGTRASEIKDYLAISQEYLDEAMELTQNTCVLTRRLGIDRLVYIKKSEPPVSIRVSTNIGISFPITAGSHGKCILAYLEPKKRREIISKNIISFTEKTITDSQKLEKEFEEIRNKGYAISLDEHISGVSGIAVPIKKPDKTVDMTISCIFITSSVEKKKFTFGAVS